MSATPKKKRKIGRPKKNEAWRLKRFVEGTAKAVENEQLTRERDEASEPGEPSAAHFDTGALSDDDVPF